ncbi:MAG: cofactor-independent phosphoglycerate mutase [Candidatus Omnitrophota bacterium]
MKYIVLVGDGMFDYPLQELNGKTPLEAAKTPYMDFIAKEGLCGMVNTIPMHMTAGSDVANLSILGYDPVKYYTGRGPLEAANLGVVLSDNDYAFRCNLITENEGILIDYSAGHIGNKEAKALIKFIDHKLSNENIKFYPGVSYRHLMKITVTDKKFTPHCEAPHDILGKEIERHLPKGPGSQVLVDLMLESRKLLTGHEINEVRIDLKENPANMIWLWGQGKTPKLKNFYEKFGISGAIISAVDLIKGIGKIIGLEVIEVPGATGYYDTNFRGKAEYALNSLELKDFVFVHVEAPDEAGHSGDIRAKITAIENFDSQVVGVMLEKLKEKGEEFRILVLPDHATPISIRTHTNEPVGFAIYGSGIQKDSVDEFNEKSLKNSSLKIRKGNRLLELLLRGEEKK